MPSKLLSEAARQMNAARKNTRNAGRKRSDRPRCDCGVMTLRRSLARGKSSEHQAGCSFYRARVA